MKEINFIHTLSNGEEIEVCALGEVSGSLTSPGGKDIDHFHVELMDFDEELLPLVKEEMKDIESKAVELLGNE